LIIGTDLNFHSEHKLYVLKFALNNSDVKHGWIFQK
jgi:hypothetical protein